MKHKRKGLRLIKILSVIGLLFLSTAAYADDDETDEPEGPEPGQMTINSHVIHETREIDHSHFGAIGQELVPFLFLDDMRAVEAHRAGENEALLTRVREDLFLATEPDTSVDIRELTAELFLDEETTSQWSPQETVQAHYFEIPTWVMIIGVTIATGFLVYLATQLGKKLNHVIHKKKEEKASG